MDKLTSMKVFVYVVEQGSFRSAANHFNLSATMISKHVHSLETGLNSQLIHRTTRKQSLTDSGQLYYRECKRILEDISNAENLIQTLENQPQGTVKINCPVTYGNKVIAPIVAKFLAHHPTINVELMLNNDLVDPYSSDIDLMVRIGDLSDSSLVARYLGDYEMCYCAAPDYLNQHAEIKVLEDLAQHPSLGFGYSSQAYSLTLQNQATVVEEPNLCWVFISLSFQVTKRWLIQKMLLSNEGFPEQQRPLDCLPMAHQAFTKVRRRGVMDDHLIALVEHHEVF